MQRRTFALVGCAAGVLVAGALHTGSPSATAAPGFPRAVEAADGVHQIEDQVITKQSGNSSATISQGGGANSTATITQNGRSTTMQNGVVVGEDSLPDDEDATAGTACLDEPEAEPEAEAEAEPDAEDEACDDVETGEVPGVDTDLDGRTASARVDQMRRDAIRDLENQSGLDLRGVFPD